MKSSYLDIWYKLRRAEKRLESLSRELETLDSQKQGYLQEIVRGGQLFIEVKEADQAIKKKGLAISKAKEKVGNLRSLLEGDLARFRKELIEEKKRELDEYVEQRARYLKRVEELEVETSRYRYLITGKKDLRLADVKDPLPSDIPHHDDFEPIDEVMGHIKLQIHKIIRMSSGELLKEYLSRRKTDDQNP